MNSARFCIAVLLAAAIQPSVGQAQDRSAARPPNLSGAWTAVDVEDSRSSPLGPRFTVTQDAATVTLTGVRDTVTYPLDGSNTQRTQITTLGQTWTLTAQARFVTAALLVTTKTDAGSTGRWEDLMVLSLDTTGQLTLVSSAAAKSVQPAMNTSVFKYVRK